MEAFSCKFCYIGCLVLFGHIPDEWYLLEAIGKMIWIHLRCGLIGLSGRNGISFSSQMGHLTIKSHKILKIDPLIVEHGSFIVDLPMIFHSQLYNYYIYIYTYK